MEGEDVSVGQNEAVGFSAIQEGGAPDVGKEKVEKQEYKDSWLADEEKGKFLVEKVRKAVFDEYDRARLEGNSSKEDVDMQKKHVETVREFAMLSVDRLREGGIEVSQEQERLIEIESLLHDALKIVPERTDIDFRARLSATRNQRNYFENRLGKIDKQSGEAKDIKSKLAELNKKIGELIPVVDYQREDFDPQAERYTRLLTHGEDTAEWADQLLDDMGFSRDLIEKVKDDLVSHMGMPYVLARKDDVSEGKVTAEFPKDLPGGTFPHPTSFEAAVLLASDFLSPTVLAGKDVNTDPAAGSFDRYVRINLGIFAPYARGMEPSFNSALGSVSNNVERLQNPPTVEERIVKYEQKEGEKKEDWEKRLEQGKAGAEEAMKVEKFLGDNLGKELTEKCRGFETFIQNGVVVDGKEVRGFDNLNVFYPVTEDPDGPKMLDVNATMENYFMAVDAYRKEKGFNVENIMER